jgi:hypothetical protein
VYIVGAHALGTDNAMSTVRSLPNPLVGARTADMRPPILFPPSNPAVQDGTAGADAVKAAPKKCGTICPIVSATLFWKRHRPTLPLKKAR